MEIQRGNWAGIYITSGSARIVIDPVASVNNRFFGNPTGRWYDLEHFGDVDAVFCTHIHSDHFDHQSVMKQFGPHMPIYAPADTVMELENFGFTQVIGMHVGSEVEVGSLRITATYAVDGLGDPQVSWVIRDAHQVVFHGGDTLWHGYWWRIAKQFGPFDTVFLPINAPVVLEEGMTASGLPICMGPEQAVAATMILAGKTLVPIHYGTFHNPPVYVQTGDPIAELETAAEFRGVCVQELKVGERLQNPAICTDGML